MKVRTVRRLFREGVIGLWRNRIMSLASIGSVTAVLLVLGLFLVIIFNINSVVESVESDIEVKAFLEEGLSQDDINLIRRQIQQIDGIQDIAYETKEEALIKYQQKLGDDSDLLEGLEGEYNPLPNSYIVKVEDPETISRIAEKARDIEGVEGVEYGADIVDKLLKATHFIRVIGIALICIFTLISIFIISNTIKLTVAARRKEISIMKYVGATEGFIRFPFVIEGFILGIMGALISSGILMFTYRYINLLINRNFAGLYLMLSGRLAPFYDTMHMTTLILVVSGALVGIIGSRISLRKFLKV